MSLNNIKLPESVITGLYKQPLIPASEVVPRVGEVVTQDREPEKKVITETTTNTVAAAHSQYRFLGNNLKRIVLVVQYPDEVFLPDEQLQFLTKILGACKLNLGDVAILNHGSAAIEIEKVKKQLQPRHVIIFGLDPVAIGLPIRFPEFKEQEYADVVYLLAPAPDELNKETKEGKVLKSKLWVCLLKMFQV